jgi:type II secretory pathway pseudopilin PulG
LAESHSDAIGNKKEVEMRKAKRLGLSLIELLIAVGIVAVLIGLLLPAIQNVREAALFTRGQNQLRQIGLATHNYCQDNDGALPCNMTQWVRDLKPVTGFVGSYITCQSSLLPYIEQDWLFQAVFVIGLGAPYTLADQYGIRVRCYQNPLDLSVPALARAKGDDALDCSYVSNAWVFSMPRSIDSGFADGLSNTIFFTEHYMYCGGDEFDMFSIMNDSRRKGTGMGYASTAPTFADYGYNSRHTGQPPTVDFYPITSGNPPQSTATGGVTFQLAPKIPDCDPRMPNAASRRGLQVLMGDGSVMTVTIGVAPELFWGSVTPDGGEITSLQEP